MSESMQVKLRHIAITAEELLAELRVRDGGIHCASDLHQLISERDELRRHLGKVMSERDALRNELNEMT